ncbi:hypothetical protein FACS1894153_4690 [Bacteroidia bacterium]|nr:hypothetical protein FACS1894153_4690 [Bacteroidia bacterium]
MDIIIVNDGSTDNTSEILCKYESINTQKYFLENNSIGVSATLNARDNTILKKTNVFIVDYHKNKGKGYALMQGFKRAIELGYDYAITMDSDGQHLAKDITKFISVLEENRDEKNNLLIIGNRFSNASTVIAGTSTTQQPTLNTYLISNSIAIATPSYQPKANKFANKFANFWFAVQTQQKAPDTQSGFRMYPLKKLKHFYLFSARYEAELELLVRLVWRGVQIKTVDIDVVYQGEERITHFRPFKDFFRISIMNTVLTLVAVVYGWWRKLL